MSALLERIDRPGPKRLLALDGGGIRGVLAIEVLAEIESLLRARCGGRSDWVLADFFDYIGGTSTGAIIAACLALGMSVAQVRGFYSDHGPKMFGAARLVHRLQYRFDSEPLAEALRNAFGADRTIGTPELRTLLMVMLSNATTDSPWPLTNNPRAQFNDPNLADCNLDLPLWQIVRASTAAPTFFAPEVVEVGSSHFVFQDGGITPYNNPAFLLFLLATSTPYRLAWPVGAEKLLLVSVGTGTVPNSQPSLDPKNMHLLYQAGAIPNALMFAALNNQDLMCRMFGETLAGLPLDGETGDLLASGGGSGLPKLFTYVRYNAELTRAGLDRLGLPNIQPDNVKRMDSIEHMADLAALGRAVGASQVRASHFEKHVPSTQAAKPA